MVINFRQRASNRVLGLTISVGLHLALAAALLSSRAPRLSPLGGGGGFYPVSVVNMSGLAAPSPAAGSPDPLAAILRRNDIPGEAAASQTAASQTGSSARSGGSGMGGRELDQLFKPVADSAAPAPAGTGDDLAAQIARCFTQAGSGVEVTLEFGLDGQGRLSRSPTVLRPPLATIPSKRLEVEASAFQAVQSCGPYSGQGNAPHTARVTLR